MSSTLDKYFDFFEEYKCQYGENVVVLMQVGSFYEVYGVDNNVEKISNPAEISKILDIVLTKKNKKLPYNDRKNPLMVGFPCLALDKFIPSLLENNYTIIIIDQIHEGSTIKRDVKKIISPSTYTEEVDNNFLVVLYIEEIKNKVHIGLSAIDILTGKNIAHECYSKQDDNVAIDDAFSFIKRFHPREIVLSSRFTNIITTLDLINYFELNINNSKVHITDVKTINTTVNYQENVLSYVFENKTMIKHIEYINLEKKPYALISYVLLLQFIYQHNPMLLKRISKPDIYINNEHLLLATNTIEQLNIISNKKITNKKFSSLFDVINNCSTSMGKRLLKDRLLAPISDITELEKRYQQIEDFGQLFKNDIKEIEDIFGKINDIERLHRRMSLGILLPREFSNLHESYKAILSLQTFINQKKINNIALDILLSDDEYKSVITFIEDCNKLFILNNILNYDLNENINIFRKGLFPDLDNLSNAIEEEINNLKCKQEYKSNEKQIKKILKNVKTRKYIDEICNLSKLTETFKKCAKKYYIEVLDYLSFNYNTLFDRLVSFVAHIDVIKSNFKTSCKYNYCRPQIVAEVDECFIKASNLRHPIIERLNNDTSYVPNDMSIGVDYNGIILYSMNSCGKTSLLKACGTSLILAQMGCYVPASAYKFKPFAHIMTRIISDENILKSRSSFVTEMCELRSILKRADKKTLVLADEITHGTEHISGSAIFASSVMTLSERKVNFIFTTHLHNVYSFIKDINNVKVFHLSVSFHSMQSRSIVFERKLKEGPGDSIYGLEVCEFLDMDAKFIENAFRIREKIIQHSPLNTSKVSKYNREKFVNKCYICGYNPSKVTDTPLDVHHINAQSSCNEYKMIDNIHKNAKSNLVVLCKQCHIKAHNKSINITGYVDSSEGVILLYT